VNDPPTISSVANQSTNEDTPTAAIPFIISDVETPADSLIVTGSSSNQGLVPDAKNLFGGSGSNRTVTLSPPTNQYCSTTITLTVRHGDRSAARSTFPPSLHSVNDPPNISSVPDQTTDEDAPTSAIPFMISDVETNAERLIVTGSSSNQRLVPDANIFFGGSGSNRTATLRPATNQYGDRKSVV